MDQRSRLPAVLSPERLPGAFLLPGCAFAHERRPVVGDKYSLLVGLDVEPAFQCLHNLDEAVDRGKDVPAGTPARVQHTQVGASATAWPVALQVTASQLRRQLTLLRTALEAGNINAAMASARNAHELVHDLSSQAYGWLTAQANLVAPVGGVDAARD